MRELPSPRRADERVRWTSLPYWLMHVAAFGVFFVDFAWWMPVLCVGLYYLRMFGITAGYHRYFAHRGYKTSRAFQFVLAWIGLMSLQKGPLWWAGNHRHHHKYSDLPEDVHSPQRGFLWSHMLWFVVPRFDATPVALIRDFTRYPELMFFNRFWVIPPVLLAVGLFLVGGSGALFWGFFLSTVVLWHGTFTINSLAHLWGSRRYETSDTSRNNFFLSLLTMGEGWHNNHHHYPTTACNGFFWYEVDASYYILKALSWFGLVWNLRVPPAWLLEGKARAHASPAHIQREPSFGMLATEAADHVARAAAEVADAWREKAAEVREAALEVAEAARIKATEIRHAYGEKAQMAKEAAFLVAGAARAKAAAIKLACAEKAAEAAEAVAAAAEKAALAIAPPEASIT